MSNLRKDFDGPIHLGNHLKAHRIKTKDYYDVYLKKPDDGVCEYCGQPTRYSGLGAGYVKHCQKCKCLAVSATKSKWSDEKVNAINEKRKKTNLAKYGTTGGFNVDSCEKAKRTK